MAEHLFTSRKWRMRLGFLLLGLAILFVQLLPFQTLPRGWAGPDLIMVLTLAWGARRPEYVPALAVALIFLLADFILMRPPGLLAAIMVVARQAMRRQTVALRDAPFATEWLTAAMAFVVIMLADRLALAVFLLDRPPLGLSAMQLLANILVYPLVVFLSYLLFRVQKSTPGDADALAGAA